MTQAELARSLARLKASYPYVQWTDEVLAVWAELFLELEYPYVVTALRSMVAHERFASIAAFREHAGLTHRARDGEPITLADGSTFLPGSGWVQPPHQRSLPAASRRAAVVVYLAEARAHLRGEDTEGTA